MSSLSSSAAIVPTLELLSSSSSSNKAATAATINGKGNAEHNDSKYDIYRTSSCCSSSSSLMMLPPLLNDNDEGNSVYKDLLLSSESGNLEGEKSNKEILKYGSSSSDFVTSGCFTIGISTTTTDDDNDEICCDGAEMMMLSSENSVILQSFDNDNEDEDVFLFDDNDEILDNVATSNTIMRTGTIAAAMNTNKSSNMNVVPDNSNIIGTNKHEEGLQKCKPTSITLSPGAELRKFFRHQPSLSPRPRPVSVEHSNTVRNNDFNYYHNNIHHHYHYNGGSSDTTATTMDNCQMRQHRQQYDYSNTNRQQQHRSIDRQYQSQRPGVSSSQLCHPRHHQYSNCSNNNNNNRIANHFAYDSGSATSNTGYNSYNANIEGYNNNDDNSGSSNMSSTRGISANYFHNNAIGHSTIHSNFITKPQQQIKEHKSHNHTIIDSYYYNSRHNGSSIESDSSRRNHEETRDNTDDADDHNNHDDNNIMIFPEMSLSSSSLQKQNCVLRQGRTNPPDATDMTSNYQPQRNGNMHSTISSTKSSKRRWKQEENQSYNMNTKYRKQCGDSLDQSLPSSSTTSAIPNRCNSSSSNNDTGTDISATVFVPGEKNSKQSKAMEGNKICGGGRVSRSDKNRAIGNGGDNHKQHLEAIFDHNTSIYGYLEQEKEIEKLVLVYMTLQNTSNGIDNIQLGSNNSNNVETTTLKVLNGYTETNGSCADAVDTVAPTLVPLVCTTKESDTDYNKITIISKGFLWRNIPQAEQLLYNHMAMYYGIVSTAVEPSDENGALSTAKDKEIIIPQREWNVRLVTLVKECLQSHGYTLDVDDRILRDRIRCYYKTHLQNARKRLNTMSKQYKVSSNNRSEINSERPDLSASPTPSTAAIDVSNRRLSNTNGCDLVRAFALMAVSRQQLQNSSCNNIGGLAVEGNINDRCQAINVTHQYNMIHNRSKDAASLQHPQEHLTIQKALEIIKQRT